MSKGTLIVIEGLDGSGKATQAKRLCQALKEEGKNVLKISFPDYDSPSSSLVKMYLAGEFGTNPGDVNAYAASSFYAVDRYASYKTNWGKYYEDGWIIIADRYTTSNAVHQCAKLPRNEWAKYLTWLATYEFEQLGLPAPDAVIYLDVHPDVSQKLMTKRYAGDESKKDLHEKDLAYLKACQGAAAYCAEQLWWKRVICTTEDQEMRSIEDIASEVKRKADAAIAWSEGCEEWLQNPEATNSTVTYPGQRVFYANRDEWSIKPGFIYAVQSKESHIGEGIPGVDLLNANSYNPGLRVQLPGRIETFYESDWDRGLFSNVFAAVNYLYYDGCSMECAAFEAQKAIEESAEA